MIGAPMSATMTVPTLPPAMWALIAKPRRSGGNCSASRPLPTGCCGEPPIRDRTLAIANVPKPPASAWAANPPPNRRPPVPSRTRREKTPGQRRERQLDEPRDDRPERGEVGDLALADPELVDDLEVDQRQQDGVRVVDRVGDDEQPERAHRPDVDRRGRGGRDWRLDRVRKLHARMMPHLGPAGWSIPHVVAVGLPLRRSRGVL